MDKAKKILKTVLRFVIRSVVMCYLKLIYWYKVEGIENIPKERPFILCANHRTYVDGQLIVATCPRNVVFLAKKELLEKNPFFRFLGWTFGVVPVSRDNKDIATIKNTLKVLKTQPIAIFPEGTRNGIEKNLPIKEGTAFFAIKSQVPVICCGIVRPLKPFTKNYVKYSKPLDFSKFKNPKSQEELKEVTQIIMDEIATMANLDKEKIKKLI